MHTNPRQLVDRIARQAASLYGTGRVATVGDAISVAMDRSGASEASRPSVGRVRRHIQAMSMQALGEAGYRESIREVWRIAEEVLSALELAFPDAPTLLAGRAARGHIDGGGALHIRLYTRRRIGEIAAALVEIGYAEPAFETVDTHLGRANRLRFIDDGQEVVITRCLPRWQAESDRDLFTGRVQTTVTLPQLREQLAEDSGA